MDSVPSQGSRPAEYPFRNTYAKRVQPDNSNLNSSNLNNPDLKFESDTPILDETIEIVQEKVWSFRSALKAAAEALVNFGLPPQVVGYEQVPLGDDDEKLAQKNEGEAALQKAAEEEMNGRYSSSGSNSRETGRGEGSSLVKRPEDMDDTNHAFAESVRKEKEERRSLNRNYDLDDEEDDQEGRGN